jgi:hypothetical protein
VGRTAPDVRHKTDSAGIALILPPIETFRPFYARKANPRIGYPRGHTQTDALGTLIGPLFMFTHDGSLSVSPILSENEFLYNIVIYYPLLMHKFSMRHVKKYIFSI